MTRERITHYAIVHTVGSTSNIVVYYRTGGQDTLTKVSTAEALYIIDLLRNEKPWDYDAERGQLVSAAREPIGEEERE